MRDRFFTRLALCALLATLAACNEGSGNGSSAAAASSISSSDPMVVALRASASVSSTPQTGLALVCVGAKAYTQAAACLTHEFAPLQPGLYFESYPTVVASWRYTDPNYGYRLASTITPTMGVIICPIAVVPYQPFTGTDPCGPTSHSMVAASTLGISAGSSSSSSSSSRSSSGSSSSGSSTGSSSSSGGTGPAAQLAAKLGAPSRLLLGEEEESTANDIAAWEGLGLPHPDIYQRYLGSGWTTWNRPAGAYATIVMQTADAAGAIPFFTLYQINGDITTIANQGKMATYWASYKLLLEMIAAYGKPVLINFEPDGWGFMEQQKQDATQVFAYVDNNPDCADQPNTAVGMGHCLLSMRAKYAPNAYVGFPYSDFGGKAAQVTAFMRQVGAGQADYIVGGTLDVSVGCLETFASQPSGCARGPEGQHLYWDETNTTHPNFQDAFNYITAYRSGIGGNLPIIWWQTPEA